jgi:hypothetical protein
MAPEPTHNAGSDNALTEHDNESFPDTEAPSPRVPPNEAEQLSTDHGPTKQRKKLSFFTRRKLIERYCGHTSSEQGAASTDETVRPSPCSRTSSALFTHSSLDEDETSGKLHFNESSSVAQNGEEDTEQFPECPEITSPVGRIADPAWPDLK